MIESLDGIFETVNYKKSTTLKLYDNTEYEDYPMHWHPARSASTSRTSRTNG